MNTRTHTIKQNGKGRVELITPNSGFETDQTLTVPEVDLSVSVENMIVKQFGVTEKFIEFTEKILHNRAGEVDFQDDSSINFCPDGTVQIVNKKHFRLSKD